MASNYPQCGKPRIHGIRAANSAGAPQGAAVYKPPFLLVGGFKPPLLDVRVYFFAGRGSSAGLTYLTSNGSFS
jgi:hypothetical protein